MGRRADDGKRDEWISRFRRRGTSGLTVATFCEWECVSVAAFYRWQKKLRAGDPKVGQRQAQLFQSGPVLRCQELETAHPLPPISAAKRPPATEACFLFCKSCESLLPSNNLHPLNFLLRFLPRSFLWGGRRIQSGRSRG